MNLLNFTRMQAGVTVATDHHGHENVVVVAKGTFDVHPDGRCTPSSKQQPLVYADVFRGEPGFSSVLYETDFAPRKPRADFVVNGSAHAPHGEPAPFVDVAVEFGPVRKGMRVFGDRVWESSLLGLRASEPQPFVTMPIIYERAFGGADKSDPDEKHHAFESRNLVGVGLNVRRGRRDTVGTPLPNVERFDAPLGGPRQRPEPIGLGYVGRGWAPRRDRAGTYDQDWIDKHFPFLPPDFDEAYYQGAPDDQQCPHPAGGERVTLVNLTADGRMSFELPAVEVPVKLVYKGEPRDVAPVLDTVVVEPDERRCLLTWRATARHRGKLSDLRAVWVGRPTPARLRALESGKQYIDWRTHVPRGVGS